MLWEFIEVDKSDSFSIRAGGLRQLGCLAIENVVHGPALPEMQNLGSATGRLNQNLCSNSYG